MDILNTLFKNNLPVSLFKLPRVTDGQMDPSTHFSHLTLCLLLVTFSPWLTITWLKQLSCPRCLLEGEVLSTDLPTELSEICRCRSPLVVQPCAFFPKAHCILAIAPLHTNTTYKKILHTIASSPCIEIHTSNLSSSNIYCPM